MTIQITIFAASLLIQAVLAWRLITTHRALDRVNARLSHHGEALSLLTDTSENGFGAIARELERLAADPRPQRRASTRRVATAARKGRTVSDIAAAEQVSEGEVRLRLHMAAADASGR